MLNTVILLFSNFVVFHLYFQNIYSFIELKYSCNELLKFKNWKIVWKFKIFDFFLNLEASIQIILAFILLILGVLSYVPCPLKNP